MKRWKVLSRLALAAGFVLMAAVPAAVAQTATKVAVINVVQLLEESDEGKQRIDSLKALQKQKTDERTALQEQVKELRAKITDGKFSLAEDKLGELEKELEDKLIGLQRFNDDANRELEKAQEKMLLDIQGKVLPIINAVGKEGGYTLIFNKFEAGLVYADEAVDITDEVMERLNGDSASQAETSGS